MNSMVSRHVLCRMRTCDIFIKSLFGSKGRSFTHLHRIKVLSININIQVNNGRFNGRHVAR